MPPLVLTTIADFALELENKKKSLIDAFVILIWNWNLTHQIFFLIDTHQGQDVDPNAMEVFIVTSLLRCQGVQSPKKAKKIDYKLLSQ